MGRHKKNHNASSSLLMIAVVMLCMIFMANSWVSNEIEETHKIGVPAPSPSSNSPRRNMLAYDRSGYVRSTPQTEAPSMEGESYRKSKKRKKIIYEIPLDDVNLLQ